MIKFLLMMIVPFLAHAELLYQKPEESIDRLLRAKSFSQPLFNHQKTAVIRKFREFSPPISYVSRPKAMLGGVRFFTGNYSSSSKEKMYYTTRIEYFDLKTRQNRKIGFREGAILREIDWAPDGRHLAVSIEEEFCHEVWLVSIPSLERKKIDGVCLNSILANVVQWTNSNELLLAIRTPQQAKPLVLQKSVPTGPVVQESDGKVSQNRTYADLLKSPQDENLFERAASSQLLRYNLKTQKKTKLGKPALFIVAEPSPNRKFLMVEKIERPFSYTVPYYRFAKRTEILTSNGILFAEVERSEVADHIPIQGVRTGPREVSWMKNAPQTLIYVEALDQGDWNVKVEHRDEVFLLPIRPSGKLEKVSLMKLKNRFENIYYLNAPDSLMVQEFERDKEWLTTYLVQKKESNWNFRELFSVGSKDDYKNPGEPVLETNSFEEKVVAVDRQNVPSIFFSGKGASPEGERPFLRKLNLESLEMTELFRSGKIGYEFFRSFSGQNYSNFYTSFETPTQAPGLFSRSVTAIEKPRELVYQDENPYEPVTKIKKEIISYKRADGVQLSGVLYYPLNYEKGKRYPAIVQAYPLEYTDSSTAGQIRGSQEQFERPLRSAMVYHALRGYVVLDEAQMPIIGHPETKNDTYIEQLTAGAKAAVDALNARELIDPKRVGVIGHSYGAFMVANLLSHTNLFAAGVAESGAYNRTLTPFGFQGERRTFWKAQETYERMSPFTQVEKMKTPLLLIHGVEDSNAGTSPMQTERYFEALKGQGAPVKLLMLPEEDHWYAALESTEHQLWELFHWFDRYLKRD